ncbi:unnamed protein product, partial [Ectocarpus sp. 6 AP-2014]
GRRSFLGYRHIFYVNSLPLWARSIVPPERSGPMSTRRREQVPAADRPQQQQQPAQQHQQQEEEMVTTSRRLLRLRGFGCGGSWCKPPVLSPDTAAANSRVSA